MANRFDYVPSSFWLHPDVLESISRHEDPVAVVRLAETRHRRPPETDQASDGATDAAQAASLYAETFSFRLQHAILCQAVKSNHVALICLIFDNGFSLQSPFLPFMRTKPFHLACYLGVRRTVECFLSAKPDLLQLGTVEGLVYPVETPLVLLLRHDDVDLLQPWLSRIDAADNPKCSALHVAAIEGAHRCLAHLAQRRPQDVNARDSDGRMALNLAVHRRRGVEVLLTHGASVGPEAVCERTGSGPLHALFSLWNNCSPDLVETTALLLDAGADANQLDGKGRSPLMELCHNISLGVPDWRLRRLTLARDCVVLLLQRGVTLDGASGNAPLMEVLQSFMSFFVRMAVPMNRAATCSLSYCLSDSDGDDTDSQAPPPSDTTPRDATRQATDDWCNVELFFDITAKLLSSGADVNRFGAATMTPLTLMLMVLQDHPPHVVNQLLPTIRRLTLLLIHNGAHVFQIEELFLNESIIRGLTYNRPHRQFQQSLFFGNLPNILLMILNAQPHEAYSEAVSRAMAALNKYPEIEANAEIDGVCWRHLAMRPRTLRQMSRCRITSCLGRQVAARIPRLPLSEPLKAYLLNFED